MILEWRDIWTILPAPICDIFRILRPTKRRPPANAVGIPHIVYKVQLRGPHAAHIRVRQRKTALFTRLLPLRISREVSGCHGHGGRNLLTLCILSGRVVLFNSRSDVFCFEGYYRQEVIVYFGEIVE